CCARGEVVDLRIEAEPGNSDVVSSDGIDDGIAQRFELLALEGVERHPLVAETDVPVPPAKRSGALEEELADDRCFTLERSRARVEREDESGGCGDHRQGAVDQAADRTGEAWPEFHP